MRHSDKNLRFSPLFWPIQLKKHSIAILDETLLPHKLNYIKVANYREACRAIKEMKTRAVGQVILVMYVFLLTIRQNKNNKNLALILNKVAKAINSTRPTLSFKYLTDLVLAWHKAGKPLEKSIREFLEMLKNKRIQQAREASKLIKNGDVVLTHCNVSGLMPLTGEFLRQQKKKVSFLVTETRPYMQGSRLTAWELQRQGFEVTIICDNMVGAVMQKKMVDKVMVGADNLAQNGDIANKIGTYQIALLAKYFKIPFYVLCPPVSRARSGQDIKIELRPDKELLEYQGIRLAPKGARGFYPAFDITAANLITKHIALAIKS